MLVTLRQSAFRKQPSTLREHCLIDMCMYVADRFGDIDIDARYRLGSGKQGGQTYHEIWGGDNVLPLHTKFNIPLGPLWLHN